MVAKKKKSRTGLILTIVAGTLLLANIIYIFYQGMREAVQEFNEPAVDFTLPVLSHGEQRGGSFTLSEHRGKVVVLDFWAMYCDACIEQMPTLQAVHKERGDQPFTLLSINGDDPSDRRRAAKLSQFMAEKGYSFLVALDDGKVGYKYKVDSLPRLYIIDGDGNIRFVHYGASSKATIDEHIELLMDEL